MEITESLRKAVFKRSLKQGTVFRMKGDTPFNSDCYHVFVVLNYDISTGNVLFLVNGTSQMEKRWKALEDIKKIDAKSTTVFIRAKTYNFLSEDTLFDCNSVHCINIDSLNFNNIKTITSDKLSENDVEKLINAVLASPMVERFIKNSIRPDQKTN